VFYIVEEGPEGKHINHFVKENAGIICFQEESGYHRSFLNISPAVALKKKKKNDSS